jgi:hypothetical protein
LRTFGSLRFRGDALEPARVTAILEADPTTAYRKGEIFKQSGGREARGRTGLWLLSSDRQVSSPELDDHLRYLLAILFPQNSEDRIRRLHDLMSEDELAADVDCFWYGKAGAAFPVISEDVRAALARLPAAIETDFQTD